jgi:translation initiation factor 4B
MAPKKSKASKMSLNEFLGDNTLGSWADEMDALPTAPSIKSDEDRLARPGDRFSRRDDFASSRPDRQFAPPREDLPLPTQPPFTAFIGNLAFDITESELESFFDPHKTKSIKIIKDRDDKPKGFGYIEFSELDALKDALSRTGSNLSGRTIRVSVAEPPKEKPGFGTSILEDDSKFSGSWRRDGPLPSFGDSREPSRRRLDGPPGERAPLLPSASDEASDWRSSRPVAREAPPAHRRGSEFSTPEAQISTADREEHWSIGSKFKPSVPEEQAQGKFGSVRGRHESIPTRDAPDEGDWRARKAPGGTSPTSSTPPTPQINRKKLELLPRSSTSSTSPSPLSSPKLASNPSAPRANPFGAAKPVDVSSKEREITARIEKDRDIIKDRGPQHSMSRTSSRQANERGPAHTARAPSVSGSPITPVTSAGVRPSFSFANAASTKLADARNDDEKESKGESDAVDIVADQVAEISV